MTNQIECMVEGHTDSVPYIGNNILLDNWDLSVNVLHLSFVFTDELG
jgi:chemotaxis protein MotB